VRECKKIIKESECKDNYTRRQINKYQNMVEPGQILRMNGSWIPKEIFDMKLKAKDLRGRPRSRCK